MSQLQKYTSGEVAIPRNDKAVALQAKVIYDQIRVAGFRVDGSLMLAEHAMRGAKALDQIRRDEAKDDITLNMVLVEIEMTALSQVKDIQRSINSGWGL